MINWLKRLFFKEGWYCPEGHYVPRFWGERGTDLSPVGSGTTLPQKCDKCNSHYYLQACHYRKLRPKIKIKYDSKLDKFLCTLFDIIGNCLFLLGCGLLGVALFYIFKFFINFLL